VPVALDYADVVEFGADIPTMIRRTTRWVPVRWYGIVIDRTPQRLIVHGPDPNPAAARAVANELRDTVAAHYVARTWRTCGPGH